MLCIFRTQLLLHCTFLVFFSLRCIPGHETGVTFLCNLHFRFFQRKILIFVYALKLRRPRQVHFCTGVVRKMNRKIRSVNSTKYALFLSTIFPSGTGSQKSQFFNKAVQKSAFSNFLISDWEDSQLKNHFCSKMEIFEPHFKL